MSLLPMDIFAARALPSIALFLSVLSSFLSAGVCVPKRSELSRPRKADWGYVEVRPGAFTFWWLEGCRAGSIDLEQKPLIIWLQGGPGASGSGYGNFEEIGPLTRTGNLREHSWVKAANLLFIDNPVGTGFSYVVDGGNFTHNNAEIASDLLTFLSRFMQDHPSWQSTPLYIFSESYGGKMSISFANAIIDAQQAGLLQVNFKAVALGDSWISPMDFVRSYSPFLKAWSLVDEHFEKELNVIADQAQEALDREAYDSATAVWAAQQAAVANVTDNVDWYNVLLHDPENAANAAASAWVSSSKAADGAAAAVARQTLARFHSDPLADFMNGPVRSWLNSGGEVVPEQVMWGSQATKVFTELEGDFMRDAIAAVDQVLSTGVPVIVYNGQLDLICCTLGVDAWLDKLQWQGLAEFQGLRPRPFHVKAADGRTAGFAKEHKNLRMYTILAAGHMVPADQPAVALHMVEEVLGARSPEHTVANGTDKL